MAKITALPNHIGTEKDNFSNLKLEEKIEIETLLDCFSASGYSSASCSIRSCFYFCRVAAAQEIGK